MREIRTYGSEGGEAKASPTPIAPWTVALGCSSGGRCTRPFSRRGADGRLALPGPGSRHPAGTTACGNSDRSVRAWLPGGSYDQGRMSAGIRRNPSMVPHNAGCQLDTPSAHVPKLGRSGPGAQTRTRWLPRLSENPAPLLKCMGAPLGCRRQGAGPDWRPDPIRLCHAAMNHSGKTAAALPPSPGAGARILQGVQPDPSPSPHRRPTRHVDPDRHQP